MATLMVGDKQESERWGRGAKPPRHSFDGASVRDNLTGRKLSISEFTKLMQPHVIYGVEEKK